MSKTIELRYYAKSRQAVLTAFDQLVALGDAPQMSVLVHSRKYYVRCWTKNLDTLGLPKTDIENDICIIGDCK